MHMICALSRVAPPDIHLDAVKHSYSSVILPCAPDRPRLLAALEGEMVSLESGTSDRRFLSSLHLFKTLLANGLTLILKPNTNSQRADFGGIFQLL
jgi:hypothetical protein